MNFRIIDSRKSFHIYLIPFLLIVLGLTGIALYQYFHERTIFLALALFGLFGSILSIRYIIVDSKGFKITKNEIIFNNEDITILEDGKETIFKIERLSKITVSLNDYDHGAPGIYFEQEKEVLEIKLSKSKYAYLNPLTYLETDYIPNRGNENYLRFTNNYRSFEYEFYILRKTDIQEISEIIHLWKKISNIDFEIAKKRPEYYAN